MKSRSAKILGFVKSKEAFELGMEKANSNEFAYPRYQHALIHYKSDLNLACQLLLDNKDAKYVMAMMDRYGDGYINQFVVINNKSDLEIKTFTTSRKVVRYLKCEVPLAPQEETGSYRPKMAAEFLTAHSNLMQEAMKEMTERPAIPYSEETKYLKTTFEEKCLDCNIPNAPSGQQHQPQEFERTTRYVFLISYQNPSTDTVVAYEVTLKQVRFDIQQNYGFRYSTEVKKFVK